MTFKSIKKLSEVIFLGLVFFCSLSNLTILNAQEYLDKVINRLNTVEKELESIKDVKSTNKIKGEENYRNAIATHEKRLVDIEEDIRSLNGILEELNFELSNLTETINEIKESFRNNQKLGSAKGSNQYVQEESLEKNDQKEYRRAHENSYIIP